MGLTMRERHAIDRELAPRFRQATKKHRGTCTGAYIRTYKHRRIHRDVHEQTLQTLMSGTDGM